MRMTAAVMHQQALPTPYAESLPFHIEDVELEGPGEGEVLVEVRAAGLCHSDLSTVAGTNKRMLPVIGGHEGAGIVRDVGSGVARLKPGDHVVMTVASGCGHCRYCNNDKSLLCESVGTSRGQGLLTNGARRLSYRGRPAYHYAGISSFAQYSVTVPQALVKIDDSVPLDVAAMFGCAVVTGAGCVFNKAQVRPGEHVAVFGLGGVGLNSVMASRIAGAAEIVGIDINDAKFALARKLGCTSTFLATDPELVAKVKARTDGGVDYAFEMSGAKPAMVAANAILAKGGEVVCVGLGSFTEQYSYTHAMLVVEEKSLRGSFMGSGVAERDIPRYVRMYLDGKLPVDLLKSGLIGFDKLNLSLDQLDRGEVLRQVLLPHGKLAA
jgi:alcohol dehydrogenase